MASSFTFPCCVEYAKSSRSQCQRCHKTISKSAIRVGQQYNRDHSGYLWYHLSCFRGFPTDGTTTAETFLFGFENLSAADQAKVENAFQGNSGGGASSPSKRTTLKKEKKRTSSLLATATPAWGQPASFPSVPQSFSFGFPAQKNETQLLDAAFPGLSKALAQVGMNHHPFFRSPPDSSRRALRAALEAFEITGEQHEFIDTLKLISTEFTA